MTELTARARKLIFAKEMCQKLETQISEGAGVVSVSFDGVSVTYSRDQALKELNEWEKKVHRLSRPRGRTVTMRLDNVD